MMFVSKQEISFTVEGEPASKANSRRAVMFGKRPAFIKSHKALTYLDLFRVQVPILPILLDMPLCVELHIWYASRRPDLDESLVLDAMQGRIYVNDRQIQERHTYWNLDRDRPRVAITIRPIEDRAGAAEAKRARPRRQGSEVARLRRILAQ